METGKPQPLLAPAGHTSSGRLDSWKEIASYFKRDERTVRRWEKEGLPVHRHLHTKKSTVYAYAAEIDMWWRDGDGRLEVTKAAGQNHRRRRLIWSGALTLLIVLVASGVNGLRNRLLGRPAAGEISSIAVLPLKNLSGDPAQDYFADGMTEALITELGKISALQVLSHQSVSVYRQTAKPIPEIARELKVAALLEGTVLQSGTRVRITTNLVQAMPERHLWAESYEFDRQDVLAVQGEVARDVTTRIRIKVTPQEQARLTTSRRIDAEAYEAYLLGRAYLFNGSLASNATRAREYFEKAIKKDPGYAPAYASLAELSLRARVSPPKDPSDARLQARYWAAAALKLDDTLAEAHNALARALQQEWDWAGAEREYRRAIDLNANYPVARIWYAMYLDGMQRFDEAMLQAKRAQQQDPASPFINTWAAATYLYGGRFQEGMASVQKALELDSTHSNASIVAARTYVTQQKYAQAIAELQRALTLKNDREPLLLGALAHAYARGGQRDEAEKVVQELKRSEKSETPFGLVWAYAGLGDNDQAFVWLEKAYMERRDRMVWLNVDPLLDPLRSDPRFDDLVRRVGLPTKSSPPPR